MDDQKNTQGGGGPGFYDPKAGDRNRPFFPPGISGIPPVNKSTGEVSFGAAKKGGETPDNLPFYKNPNEGGRGRRDSGGSPFKFNNNERTLPGESGFSSRQLSPSDFPRGPAISEPEPVDVVNKQAPTFYGGSGRSGELDNGASLRTMASDISSIRDSGGGAPSPYKPRSLDESGAARDSKAGQSPIRQESFAGGSVFPAPGEQKASFSSAPKKKRGGGGKIFAIAFSLLIVLGAGAAGYFFVFPIFFEKELPPDVNFPPPPSDGKTTIVPPSGKNDDLESGIIPLIEPAPTGTDSGAPKLPPKPVYSSFLTEPADGIIEVAPKTVDIAEIRKVVPFAPSQLPSLKKLVIKDEADKEALLSRIGPAIAPAIFTGEALDFFEERVEVLIYENAKGTWPIYILKAKENSEVDARLQMEKIEVLSIGDLGGFFLKSPGGGNEWKDGSVSGKAARYIAFQQSDAALSYIWLDNYLLINTNYVGGQEAAKRLGF